MEATSTLIVLKELAGHAPVTLDPLQVFILQHIGFFTNFWIVVWWLTAAVLVAKFVREYRAHRNNRS